MKNKNYLNLFCYLAANLKEPHATAWSPLADGERKDSLSVNVEFIKFHLSRSRKLNFESVPGPKTTSDQSHATIRFSSKYLIFYFLFIIY